MSQQKDYENFLKQKKKQYSEFIESQALIKFAQHIDKIQSIIDNYHDQNKVENLIDSVPIPESIADLASKMKSKPKKEWIKLNPLLKCNRFTERPFFIKDCPSVPTNMEIFKFIEQILPIFNEISDDMEMAQCAIKLQYPKMHDGKYTGIELLEEMLEKIDQHQVNIDSTFNKLINYNSQRADMVIDAIKYGHLEDYRISIQKFDENFYLILDKTLNDLYNSCILVYNLFKQNHTELMEFVKKNQESLNDNEQDLCFF